MKTLERAVEIIVEDIRTDVEGYYQDWEIENWQEYLDATGRDSADFKEDVYYMLSHSEINGTGFMRFTDDCEIIEDDGTVVSYRQLMNQVRKAMGW